MDRNQGSGLPLRRAWAPVVAVLVAAVGLASCEKSGSSLAAKRSMVVASLPNCPPAVPENINQISVSGKNATITFKDPRNVPPSGAGLRWKLNTNGYTFTGNGIAIATPPAGAASSSTGTEFQWCFGPTGVQTHWKYSISFFADAAPATVFTCDPTIISSADVLGSDSNKTLVCPAP